MHKSLLILCHPSQGNAASQREQADLHDRFKRNAQRIGVWMASHNLIPQEVICHPSGASQTAAEKSCKSAGLNETIVRACKSLLEPSVKLLRNEIGHFHTGTERGFVVVPSCLGIEFCEHVCSEPPAELPDPGSDVLIHLRCREEWESIGPGSTHVQQVLDPATLPKKFPFPDVHGPEQRPRPAYYYRQSAVIPFRVRDGQLEVLVISTSKRKRWGVPKGIHDPGKTAQGSAANEAMEEAGVLGNVWDIELGSYTYSKWGGTCSVRVYPMEVTQVLTRDAWPESHRGREWLSPTAAADRVHQVELKTMIRNLSQQVSKGARI